MRVVFGDHVGHFVQRREALDHPVGHEVVDSRRPGRIHARHDVDEHNGAGDAGRNLAGEQHRRETAERCAHENGVRRQLREHLADVFGERDDPVVTITRPVGLAVAPEVNGDGLPAAPGHGCRRPGP
jgi:hypothetical protein